MRKKLYYAHSIITYGTKGEKRELQRIRKRFPDHEIVNPAEIKFTGDSTEIMQAYIEVVEQADIIVLSEYRKHIGKGVTLELEAAIKENLERYLLRGRKFIAKFASEIINPEDWKVKYARIVV